MTHPTPPIDELAERIRALPEMARYQELRERLRSYTVDYTAAMSALAQCSAAFHAASLQLRAAVRQIEEQMLREEHVRRVTLEMSPGDVERRLRELIRESAPVELPYEKPRRTQAQWKGEVSRSKGKR